MFDELFDVMNFNTTIEVRFHIHATFLNVPRLDFVIFKVDLCILKKQILIIFQLKDTLAEIGNINFYVTLFTQNWTDQD